MAQHSKRAGESEGSPGEKGAAGKKKPIAGAEYRTVWLTP